jgi:hypothetical protein
MVYNPFLADCVERIRLNLCLVTETRIVLEKACKKI